MARKNRNARPQKVTLAANTALVYNPEPMFQEDTVVRYMGEQDGESLKCWHPEGYEFWTHIANLSRFFRAVAAA